MDKPTFPTREAQIDTEICFYWAEEEFYVLDIKVCK